MRVAILELHLEQVRREEERPRGRPER